MLDVTRFSGIFNPTENNKTISVVGLGSIGSSVSECLVRIGFNNFKFIDNDIVSEENISNQLYFNSDIGTAKVISAKNKLLQINPDIIIDCVNNRVDNTTVFDTEVVFCCVDSMEARKIIFERCKSSPDVKIFIDGRMGGNVFRVFSVKMDIPDNITYYERTIYPDDHSISMRCSEKSIIYNIFGVGSFMISQLIKIILGKCFDKQVVFDYETLSLLRKN